MSKEKGFLNEYDIQGILKLIRDRKQSVIDDVNNEDHYKYMCELEEKIYNQFAIK